MQHQYKGYNCTSAVFLLLYPSNASVHHISKQQTMKKVSLVDNKLVLSIHLGMTWNSKYAYNIRYCVYHLELHIPQLLVQHLCWLVAVVGDSLNATVLPPRRKFWSCVNFWRKKCIEFKSHSSLVEKGLSIF